jgi:hypothetical protein
MLILEGIQHSFGHRMTALLDDTQDFRNGMRNQGRIRQSSKLSAVNAVRISVGDLHGDAQGETGLAAASSTCQRDQSGRSKQTPDFC